MNNLVDLISHTNNISISSEHFSYFKTVCISFFFLLCPFLALNVFISFTGRIDRKRQQRVALKITGVILLIAAIFYFFGNFILQIFAIEINGLRVGSGLLLLLTAISMVRDDTSSNVQQAIIDPEDYIIVPIAIPTILGPATISAILVRGAEVTTIEQTICGALGLGLALFLLGLLLWFSSRLQKVFTERNLKLLSKITGIILSAIAANMILTGAKELLGITQLIELAK